MIKKQSKQNDLQNHLDCFIEVAIKQLLFEPLFYNPISFFKNSVSSFSDEAESPVTSSVVLVKDEVSAEHAHKENANIKHSISKDVLDIRVALLSIYV